MKKTNRIKTLLIDINCRDTTCYKCFLLDGSFCAYFKKEMRIKKIDGVYVDFYRLLDCKKLEKATNKLIQKRCGSL